MFVIFFKIIVFLYVSIFFLWFLFFFFGELWLLLVFKGACVFLFFLVGFNNKLKTSHKGSRCFFLNQPWPKCEASSEKARIQRWQEEEKKVASTSLDLVMAKSIEEELHSFFFKFNDGRKKGRKATRF